MTLKIYTDGSCNSSKIGGWAFYIPDLNIRVGNKAHDTTNNRMELLSVIEALEFIQDADLPYATYEIYSDSMYVIGGLTLNWKITSNEDLWGKLFFYRDLLADKNLNFYHVKGHSGDKNNEIVDKLAVLVRNLYKKNT